MKYTDKYNLNMPEEDEFVDITDLNENAEIIDTALFTIDNKLDVLSDEQSNFVNKEFRTGSTSSYKELSDNNFTDEEKAKLASLSGATSVDEGASVFNGLTASFYGDSLTEKNSHYTKGYHSWIQDILGLASYNDYGVSGYKVSDVYNKVNSINDTADIIFVMCGVNDQTFSVDLGEWGDTTTSTTYGAYYCLCNLLKTKYPTKPIIFITPHYQTKYPHSSGITSYEIGEAMKKTCDKFSIPCYDNRVMSGIYTTNLSTFTTDNCHWNDKGHEMVGKNLARWVIDNVRYVYGATASTISVTGVSLNKTSLSLVEGSYETLIATVSPSNATNKNVIWSSSDASIATVVGGKVTAVKTGSVTITVTTEDGSKTASCSVEVTASTVAVTGVSLNKSSLSLSVGENETLTATVSPSNATNKNVIWTTSDNSIATVSNGKVIAVKAGSVTITVTTEDGSKTASCSVKVSTVAVTGVTLNKTSASIETGSSETLIATIAPTNATNKNVTWKSSDDSIATVENGVVTAVKEGSITITATAEDGGYMATCAVVVVAVKPTVTVEKQYQNTMAHLTAVLPADSDMVSGKTVVVNLIGSNATNMFTKTTSGGALFTSANGNVNDGEYISQISAIPNQVQTVDGTTVTITSSAVINSTVTTGYLKVPIVISGTVPYSFAIDSLSILINGVEKAPNIIKLGAFFASDKEIINVTNFSVDAVTEG